MIKKLKNFICKLFGIKQCACSDKDEHLQLYEDSAEPETPMYTDVDGGWIGSFNFFYNPSSAELALLNATDAGKDAAHRFPGRFRRGPVLLPQPGRTAAAADAGGACEPRL